MFLFLICHPDVCHSMVTYIKWDNQNYLFESQNNETSTYDWNKLRDILGLPHDLCLNLRTGWGELRLSLTVAHGRWWQSMCGPPSQVCAISLTATPGSPWNKTLYSLCDYARVIFLFFKKHAYMCIIVVTSKYRLLYPEKILYKRPMVQQCQR